MMHQMSKQGYEYGIRLVEALCSGTFQKENRPNHGHDFTGGEEGLHMDQFRSYISSCGGILMDERMKVSIRRGYYG